jgi:chromosome partitioning protein
MTGKDFVGMSEIAQLAGVTKQAVANWRDRDSDFPEPVASLKQGSVWKLSDVLEWANRNDIRIALSETDDPAKAIAQAVTIAVLNMKGGVGKSTLATNLGWYFAQLLDKRVLLVDLDPQFNASQYALGVNGYLKIEESGAPTVVDIFDQYTPTGNGNKKKLTPETVIQNVRSWRDGGKLDLIPSRLQLSWILKNAQGKERLLANFLEKISDRYDLILIDCPPTESMLTEAAYFACDYVLVPVKPEFLATIGLPLLGQSIREFEDKENHEIELVGIVFNATQSTAEQHRAKADVRKLAREQDWHIFQNEISYSASYPSGARQGRPIYLTDYARSSRVREFRDFATELTERLKINGN